MNIYSCTLFLSSVSSLHSPLVSQLRQSLRAMYRSIVSPNFGMIISLLPHEHLTYLANIIQTSWCLLKIINNFWWSQIGNDRRCRWTHQDEKAFCLSCQHPTNYKRVQDLIIRTSGRVSCSFSERSPGNSWYGFMFIFGE